MELKIDLNNLVNLIKRKFNNAIILCGIDRFHNLIY